MITKEGGMVMREVFKNGCNAGTAPLSGGGGGLSNCFRQGFQPLDKKPVLPSSLQ
ncbi:MAG: hypothetical protein LBK53_01945 [Heliobacteriaceae bacterium]|nr:hypothetical protein [Heliobacteriaceae bacterium]